MSDMKIKKGGAFMNYIELNKRLATLKEAVLNRHEKRFLTLLVLIRFYRTILKGEKNHGHRH